MKENRTFTSIILCIISIVFLLSCRKETDKSTELEGAIYKDVGNSKTNLRGVDEDVSLLNGIIQIKSDEELLFILENYQNTEEMNLLKSRIAALGNYHPIENYSEYFCKNDSDKLNGFIFNNEHLLQFKEWIIYLDLENKRYRYFDQNNLNIVRGFLVSGNTSNLIFDYYFDERNGYRYNYVACGWCAFAVGLVSSGAGIAAGLLDIYACVACYNSIW